MHIDAGPYCICWLVINFHAVKQCGEEQCSGQGKKRKHEGIDINESMLKESVVYRYVFVCT